MDKPAYQVSTAYATAAASMVLARGAKKAGVAVRVSALIVLAFLVTSFS